MDRETAVFLIKPEVKVDEVSVDNNVVEKGLDVNKQCNKGQTPLHYACQGGNTQLMKYLLECGADVHIEDSDGFTALYHACISGYLSIVKELTLTGSDIHKTAPSVLLPFTSPVVMGGQT